MLHSDFEQIKEIVDSVCDTQDISLAQLQILLTMPDGEGKEYLHGAAREAAQRIYGNEVYLRGLIEISSHCKNNCNYCGIRRDNTTLPRYRMTTETILDCCRYGYSCGLRTFVLQGGEDVYFTDEKLIPIIGRIHKEFPDCAITLSLGERSRESYQALYDAGANRYLLRHETANAEHYAYLHPAEMKQELRMQCLRDLREIGYQVGAGFMVGSPHQTHATLWEDLQFIRTFRPDMCGIGPFVATQHTPFAHEASGDVETTLRLLSIVRLLHPHVLLPATTALGSLHPMGRELGILAGANVVMPNLSPSENRKRYNIYDNKLSTGDDIAHYRNCLEQRLSTIGYRVVMSRGDFRP